MRRLFKVSIPTFLLLAMSSSCSYPHPTDDSLLSRFRSHKSEFEQLLQMFLADKQLGRVAYDFTRPAKPAEIGISDERLKEYRELFSRLGLSAGIEGYDPKDMVMFIASTKGLSVSGSSKGFAYLTKPPGIVVSNLDEYKSQQRQSFTAFRHIEGNWYLYFDFED